MKIERVSETGISPYYSEINNTARDFSIQDKTVTDDVQEIERLEIIENVTIIEPIVIKNLTVI